MSCFPRYCQSSHNFLLSILTTGLSCTIQHCQSFLICPFLVLLVPIYGKYHSIHFLEDIIRDLISYCWHYQTFSSQSNVLPIPEPSSVLIPPLLHYSHNQKSCPNSIESIPNPSPIMIISDTCKVHPDHYKVSISEGNSTCIVWYKIISGQEFWSSFVLWLRMRGI